MIAEQNLIFITITRRTDTAVTHFKDRRGNQFRTACLPDVFKGEQWKLSVHPFPYGSIVLPGIAGIYNTANQPVGVIKEAVIARGK